MATPRQAAATLDGKTALDNGVSQPDHRRRRPARRAPLARSLCAVLNGIGTVRDDDPQLNVRAIPTERQPLRVVVDARLDTPLNARLLDGGPVLIAAAVDDPARIAALRHRGADVVVLPNQAARSTSPRCWPSWAGAASTRCLPRAASSSTARCSGKLRR